MIEIISAGLGGQGVLTSGLIISKVAMDKGQKVTWVPTYGSQMRGGPANCGVKIDDEIDIPSPFVKEIDILIAMSEDAIETHIGNMKEAGTVIVNSSIVSSKEYREDLNVYEVPISDIAINLGDPRGMNLVSLGVLIKATNLYDKDEFLLGINSYFKEKNIVDEKAEKSFIEGYNYI